MKYFILATLLSCTTSMMAQWSGTTLNGPTHRTGEVGIGTSTPDKLLVIEPGVTNDDSFLTMGALINATTGERLFNFGSSTSGNSSGYTFYDSNGKQRSSYFEDDTSTFLGIRDGNGKEIYKVSGTANDAFIHLPKPDSKVVIGDYSNYLDSEGHKFIVRGSSKIEGDIITDANIGIGTNSFVGGSVNYRLSVDGRIRAEGIKVYNTWADYVFEPDYDLPTLKEVESFIEKNGHLQDIPSAHVVAEEGIDLGEMNKLLLQKIEELTLYVIMLNKEVEELKK